MLGSFPPKRERWSMDFFYPNIQNDMWRIMGLLFYNDKDYFIDIVQGKPRFSYERVVDFCTAKHIALYDAASAVRRVQAVRVRRARQETHRSGICRWRSAEGD